MPQVHVEGNPPNRRVCKWRGWNPLFSGCPQKEEHPSERPKPDWPEPEVRQELQPEPWVHLTQFGTKSFVSKVSEPKPFGAWEAQKKDRVFGGSFGATIAHR